MGVSTDGIIFFGFPIPEDSETHERIRREMRASPDGELNPGTFGWLAWNGGVDEGVEVGYHCSEGCTMYFIAIAASVIEAHRGSPVDLTGKTCQTMSSVGACWEWRGWIEKFCRKWGVPFSEPHWYLASYWG